MQASEDLRRKLADLYPTSDDWRLAAKDSNIDSSRIDLEGKAIKAWSNILEAAARTPEGVRSLCAFIQRDCPHLLDLAKRWAAEVGVDGGTGKPRIPIHGRLIWGVLPLVIFVMHAAALWYSVTLPDWLVLLLIFALVFFVLAISTLIPPVHRLLLGFYSRDQHLIPGIGLSGLLLTIAVIVSAIIAVPAILREWRDIPSADRDVVLSLLVARLEGQQENNTSMYMIHSRTRLILKWWKSLSSNVSCDEAHLLVHVSRSERLKQRAGNG
jgi:hypothetical protein